MDNARNRFGRMLMAHMVADTEAELHEMAAKLGVARRHYQGDHYDICTTKRWAAIRLGAVPVSTREIVRVRRRATS